jgi:hypothetical protein
MHKMSKTIHIKPAPYYGKREHSLTYKLFMSFVLLLIGAVAIIGGVAVN